MDPRGKAPVAIELNATLAELLARICAEQMTGDTTAAPHQVSEAASMRLTLNMDCDPTVTVLLTGSMDRTCSNDGAVNV